MAQGDDSKQAIAQIIRQEQALIFPSFGENEAFALGHRIRDIAVKEKLGIATEISCGTGNCFMRRLPEAQWIIRNGCAASSMSCAAFMLRPIVLFWNRIATIACLLSIKH